MQRLRQLSEDECYLRCYGWVGEDDDVRVVGSAARSSREDGALVTERIRLAFEARLERYDRAA